jgi:hypothetical protein
MRRGRRTGWVLVGGEAPGEELAKGPTTTWAAAAASVAPVVLTLHKRGERKRANTGGTEARE